MEKVPLISSAPTQATANSIEETLEMLLQTDELCMHSISNLSKLHEETMSIIDNQLAIEALETGELQLGIEALQRSVQHSSNVAALYNLGLCYEQGIGVQKDRAKVNDPASNRVGASMKPFQACDYHRQAALLGHTDAQLHLSLLSNRIDNPLAEKKIESTKKIRFRSTMAKEWKKPSLWTSDRYNFTKTLALI